MLRATKARAVNRDELFSEEVHLITLADEVLRLRSLTPLVEATLDGFDLYINTITLRFPSTTSLRGLATGQKVEVVLPKPTL